MVGPRISPLRPCAERSQKSLGMVLCCCFGALLLWGGVEASHQQTVGIQEKIARVSSPEASSRLRTDDTAFEAKRYSEGAAAPVVAAAAAAAASASQEQQRHQQQQQTQLPRRRRRLQAGSGSRLGSGDTLSERRDGDVPPEGSSEQGGETRSLDTHVAVEGEGGTDPAETVQQDSSNFEQGETHEMEGLEDSSELESSSGISKNVLVIVFCAVAFIANGGFLVYVFWVM